MKKRLLCYTLAVLFAAFCPTTMFAAALEDIGGALQKDVFAEKEALAEADTVYYVDVVWGDMEFEYNAGTVVKTWNPETHSYEEEIVTAETAWSCASGSNKVTLTNHSNTSILATVTAEISEDYSEITATVDGESLELSDASEGATFTEPGAVSTGSATIKLSGKLTNENANKTEIGTVRITISDIE